MRVNNEIDLLQVLNLARILTGNGLSKSHFGYSIASGGDLNQDGFRDIVISAPFELGRGSIYVYFGEKSGISNKPSQVSLIE